MTVAEGTGLGSRMTAYRWHLVDPIPFQKSLRFEIEHKGWTFNADGAVKSGFGERVDLMSSVAFWYQEGIAPDQPPVPYGAARLPQGNALQIEVERAMAGIKAREGQGLGVPGPLLVQGRRRLRGRRARARRSTIPFDVPEDGDYELYAQLAKGSDYGDLHGAPRREAAGRARCSSTSPAPTSGRRRSSTDTRSRRTSARTTRWAGRA